MKSGFSAIIGRPNAGKSTLLNEILGQKIAITTDKAQTTRRQIRGILTTEEGQIVFIDTPGIYKPFDKLGELLLDESKLAIPDSDVILFLVDVCEPLGKGDRWIIKNILDTKTPVILVLNKIDKISEEKSAKNISTYLSAFENKPEAIKISAKTGKNVSKLIQKIFELLPQGAAMYDADTVSDETMRSVSAEIIREKILVNTSDEIPHAVAVFIESYREDETIDRISATICCEHESQKGIIIGKGGALLKKIGTQARIELEEIAQKKVFLELHVKVEKNWRKKKDLEKWLDR